MELLQTVADEVIGLFVDDGSLAVALLVWCAVVAILASVAPGIVAASGGVALAVGCIAILLVNVNRTAGRRGTGR